MWRLYRVFDRSGRLIYVGITTNPKRREAQHRQGSLWRDLIHRFEVDPDVAFTNRAAAAVHERCIQLEELPMFMYCRQGGLRRSVRAWDAVTPLRLPEPIAEPPTPGPETKREDEAAYRVRQWFARNPGKTWRDVYRNHIAGLRTRHDFAAVRSRYEALYGVLDSSAAKGLGHRT